MNIKNIHVDSYDEYGQKAAACWEADGACYHFWFKVESKVIDRSPFSGLGTIYKNPLKPGLKDSDPGYFPTRHLNASAAKNVGIVAHVFEVIEREGLIAKAIEAYKARESKKRAEAAEWRRIERIKEAGPKLYEALLNLLKAADAGSWKERRKDEARALLKDLGADV